MNCARSSAQSDGISPAQVWHLKAVRSRVASQMWAELCCRRDSGTNECWPGIHNLALSARVSDRTVKRGIAELKRLGYVGTPEGNKDGAGHLLRLHLHPDGVQCQRCRSAMESPYASRKTVTLMAPLAKNGDTHVTDNGDKSSTCINNEEPYKETIVSGTGFDRKAPARAGKPRATATEAESYPADPIRDDCWRQLVEAYPLKTGLELGRRAFCSLWGSEIPDVAYFESEVLAGLNRWKRSAQWGKEDGRFIAQIATFLVGNGATNFGRMWKERPTESEESKTQRRAKTRSSAGVDPHAIWVPPWKTEAS